MVIITEKIDLKHIKNSFSSMRFTMVATYIGVIVVTLVLMCTYIIGLLSDNLYSTEKVDMFAKANMISEIVSDKWDDNAVLSELRFGDVVDKTLAGTNIRGVITDTAYNVIYDTNKESALAGKAFMREVLKKGIDGEQSEAITDSEGLKLMTVAVPVVKNNAIIGGVYLAETVSGIDDTIRLMRNSLIAFSIMIIILVGMLSLGLSWIITEPLSDFVRVANEISKGNFNERIKIRGHSEMTKLAQTLNYMCDELGHLEEKRRKFVSDASHELKTPMAGIKLICDSLVQAENPDIEMVKDFLNDMSEEVDRLTRIVNRLLVLTKLDNSGMSLKLEEVDIKVMLDTIFKKLSAMAYAKGIQIHKNYEETEIGYVVMDYDKMYEAIYNITDNAIKYTPENGDVYMDLQDKEKYIAIKISDTGDGIPTEEREHVFERFYRLDDSRSRDTGGTGLGLAIAKESVLMHGGQIEISDRENGGTVFTTIIPKTIQI